MKFNTPYERQDYPLEEMSQEDDVIRIGYRTTEQQVREFLTAGVQLAKSRGEMYMYASEDDDDGEDTPLSPYADDPVDTFNVLQYQKELKERRAKERKFKQENTRQENSTDEAAQSEAKEPAKQSFSSSI